MKFPFSRTQAKETGLDLDLLPRELKLLLTTGNSFLANTLADSLEQARTYATPSGFVASLPLLIAGKVTAGKKNYIRENWFTALSEQNTGMDLTGAFTKAGKPLILLIHGGGILTPERIRQAHREGLTPHYTAKIKQEEWKNLLKGTLPNGENFQIYTLEDVRKANIPNPFGRYAVALDLETAQSTYSGSQNEKQFLNNPLTQARAGTLQYFADYFNKAAFRGTLGNYHRLVGPDPQQPQGRVLFVYDFITGFLGLNILDYNGRFVGVAPEARAQKIGGLSLTPEQNLEGRLTLEQQEGGLSTA